MNAYAIITVLLAIVTPNLSYPSHGGSGGQRNHHGESGSNNGNVGVSGQRRNQMTPQYGESDNRRITHQQQQQQYLAHQQQQQQAEAMNDDYNFMEPRKSNMYTIYGMPTYRGEYKPSPYYYSQLPNLNYYEDRVESSNPLDDLHEEMLQEHERDRLRQFAMGQEQWYEPQARHSPRITQAFLQNLMAYNRQANVAAAATASRDQDFESGYGGADFEQDDDYYGDESGPSMDAYDPQSQFDYRYYDSPNQKFNAQPPKPAEKTQSAFRERFADIAPNANGETRQHTANVDDQADKDDEDVRELKSLAHRGRGAIKHPSNYDDYDFMQDQPNERDEHAAAANADYDGTDGGEDDAWINWDRKRSVPQKQRENIKLLALNGGNEAKVMAEIGTVPIVEQQQHSKVSDATEQPLSKTTSGSSGVDNAVVTPVDYTSALSRLKLEGGHHGQKEVLLPRPDIPVRHPFTAPVMNILQQSSDEKSSLKKIATDDENKSKNIYDTIKQIVHMENKLNQVSDSTLIRKRNDFYMWCYYFDFWFTECSIAIVIVNIIFSVNSINIGAVNTVKPASKINQNSIHTYPHTQIYTHTHT